MSEKREDEDKQSREHEQTKKIRAFKKEKTQKKKTKAQIPAQKDITDESDQEVDPFENVETLDEYSTNESEENLNQTKPLKMGEPNNEQVMIIMFKDKDSKKNVHIITKILWWTLFIQFVALVILAVVTFIDIVPGWQYVNIYILLIFWSIIGLVGLILDIVFMLIHFFSTKNEKSSNKQFNFSLFVFIFIWAVGFIIGAIALGRFKAQFSENKMSEIISLLTPVTGTVISRYCYDLSDFRGVMTLVFFFSVILSFSNAMVLYSYYTDVYTIQVITDDGLAIAGGKAIITKISKFRASKTPKELKELNSTYIKTT
jgi:hypothetical protein